MRLLTQLGGDNSLAKELPAGPQPIWTGLRRLTDFATAWLAFGPEGGSCVETTGLSALPGSNHVRDQIKNLPKVRSFLA